MTTPPISSKGYIDETTTLDGFGTLVDAVLEHVPDLIWPKSIETYARMRNDPQLQAVLRLFTHPVRAAGAAVDPAGCRDEVVQQVADDLGLPVKGVDDEPGPARRRGFTWAEHLRVSLLDQTYGHMFFEQHYADEGGRWRLAQVQERMPQTVADVKLNRDGTLKSIVQHADMNPGTASREPEITTKDHRLVYYVNDREGANYYGRSLLRPAFGMWLIKDQVVRVHATSIRRFGLGIPYAEAQPGSTPQQIAELQRMVASFKASESAGGALPYGAVLKLAGMQGSVPDAVAFLNWLDRQMTRMALASILDMATSENGARSLGDSIIDVLMLVLQAVADEHTAVGTSQIVVPLVTANWGDDEAAPRIVAGNVSVERVSEQLWRLLEFGGVHGDPALEAHLRELLGLPAIDLAYFPKPGEKTTTGGGA